jgi:hypothetical protein
MYLQRAKDFLDEKIAWLEQEKYEGDKETLRLKYLCKLYEALAHLYCDPYLFDKGEEVLIKAEEIYKKHEEVLGRDLHRKYLMKKSSLMKKYGFFIQAL